MSFVEAIILAIVEGLTEFLPVSSTGHMIITSSLMGIAEKDFTKAFTIAIQFGAILSVLVIYRAKFIQAIDWQRMINAFKNNSFTSMNLYKELFQSVEFYLKLFVAFIPAAILGKLFNDSIDAMLESVEVVGVSLLVGGMILVFIDKWFIKSEIEGKNEADYSSGFKIGLFQCLAMIPGVSRSAATIIGGLSQGMKRKAAAEFSFFLAIPTMFAATAYKIYKFYSQGPGFQENELGVLLIGNVVAFVVAIVAIKGFISFLNKYGFKFFGYYRIALGILILLLNYLGVSLSMA
jgi:undecaprenyl-diphosphatase